MSSSRSHPDHENELTPDEVKKIWQAKRTSHFEGLDEIDISKLDTKDHKTFLEYALDYADFDLVKVCLHGKNATKVLNNLIVEEKFQSRYGEYLLSQKDPVCFEKALTTLKQCSNANNVVRFFHDSVFTIKKMPLIHYAILSHHDAALKFILQSETLHTVLTSTFENETPLEYAKRHKNSVACRLIIDVLAKNNPFAQVILTAVDPYHELKKLLEESKLQDKTTQQQLQVAGICCLILGKSWTLDELLLSNGMPYPTGPCYSKPSILDLILSTSFSNRSLQRNLVKKCLLAIERDPLLKKTALQDSANQSNLLELAFKTNDPDIINQLKEAGATLPDEPIVNKHANILIQSINENKIEFFKSHLETTNDQLLETAQYCIRNYDEKNIHNETNGKLIKFLDALLCKKAHTLSDRRSETLSDFALQFNKTSLIPLLEQHGIYFSHNKSAEQEKKYDNTIDVLSRYVMSGEINLLKTFLSPQSEEQQCELLNQMSSQGLTLAELAVIHNQIDMFAFLVNHPQYIENHHGVFDILQRDKIYNLLKIKKYQSHEYIKFQAILDTAYNNYPSDYQTPSIEPNIESKTLDSNTLKKMIAGIVVNGQMDVDTLKKLAQMDGFKHKVAKYLERLENKDIEKLKKDPAAMLEIDQLFLYDKNKKLIPQFFGVPRGFTTPTTNSGTLKIHKRLLQNHFSRLNKTGKEAKEVKILPSAPPAPSNHLTPYTPFYMSQLTLNEPLISISPTPSPSPDVVSLFPSEIKTILDFARPVAPSVTLPACDLAEQPAKPLKAAPSPILVSEEAKRLNGITSAPFFFILPEHIKQQEKSPDVLTKTIANAPEKTKQRQLVVCR